MFAIAALILEIEEAIQRERMRRAEEEARRRKEAEEAARLRRLAIIKAEMTKRLDVIAEQVNNSRQALIAHDYAALTSGLSMLRSVTAQASDERILREAQAGITELENQLETALAKKQRADAQAQLRDSELQEFLLDQVRAKLRRAEGQGSAGLDPNGYAAAQQAIEAAAAALASGANDTESLVEEAEKAIDAHVSNISSGLAQAQNARATAEEAVGELGALVDGLQADEVVMRWQSEEVAQMVQQLSQARQALAEGRYDEPDTILAEAREASANAVNNAGQNQLLADERDYIARSIASALGEMGFYVAPPTPEYPGYAETSLIINAQKDSGEGVAVSVPIKGQVLYDVAGYPIETTERVDGSGQASSCDKAEGMLLEMQKALNQHYGISMGEIGWENKDPNRRLRAADELPREDQSGRERGEQ